MALTWDINNSSSGVTLSSDKLTASFVGFNNTVRTNVAKKSGKWYWEVTALGTFLLIGISDSTTSLIESNRQASSVRYYHQSNGYKYPELSSYGASYSTNDTIGVALDLDNGTLEFYKNGVSQGISHTNIKTLNEIYPTVTVSQASTSTSCSVNFGDTPFKYQIPNGYSAYKEIESVNKFLILSNGEYLSLENGELSKNIIPKLTSNNSPEGDAISSGEQGSYVTYLAFNGDNSNNYGWLSNATTGWIGFKFTNKKKVIKYSMQCPPGSSAPVRSPKNWTFEGSNNGSQWTILDTKVNQTGWSLNEIREFNISNNEYYSYYRVNITLNNGDPSYVCIGELEMFEITESILKYTPSNTEFNFIKYGIDKGVTIGLESTLTNKIYISQDSASLGSGKVFSKTIDTAKTPIKKVTIK